MIFHKRLPSPAPRLRTSALKLASDLGVELEVVMDALSAVGEHVDSTQKKIIEEPVIRKIYEHLGLSFSSEPTKPLPPWELRDRGGPARSVQPKPPPHKINRVPHTFNSPDQSAGLGNPHTDAADGWADSEWQLYGFTEVERDSWIASGLRRGQAKDARDLRDAGLVPPDLGKEVFGWTVAAHLREGRSLRDIIRMLDRTA